MSHDILDAAVLQQFKNYLLNKSKVYEELADQERDEEHENYIGEYFPGSKGPPNKMVELMTSPSPSKSIQSEALVNPEEENSMCTYPTTIQKLSCKNCPDNSHVNNLLESTSKTPNDWNIKLTNGPWDIPMTNEAALKCGKGINYSPNSRVNFKIIQDFFNA